MPGKPTSWTCNACDHEGEPSREHLIHVAIGRTILANRRFSPEEVRAHLQSDRYRQFSYYGDVLHDEPLGPAWLNQHIRGLICRECTRRGRGS